MSNIELVCAISVFITAVDLNPLAKQIIFDVFSRTPAVLRTVSQGASTKMPVWPSQEECAVFKFLMCLTI